MSLGTVLDIPSGHQQQYRTPSGYQAPSITVLNPNNGTVYVARNRDADPHSTAGWDYKVPSQSYAALPGPYITAGLAYQDLSGSNATGEIIVYDIASTFTIPNFHAIGIATQSQGTTVDISQGGQPQNPPAGTGRLWINAAGNLNILQPDGSNHLVYDNTNIGSVTLGGDLYGTLGNAHVGVRQGNNIGLYDINGALQRFIFAYPAGGVVLNLIDNSPLYIQNHANSVNLFIIDGNGNTTTYGSATVQGTSVSIPNGGLATGASMGGGWPIAGDLNVRRGGGPTGYVFVGDAQHYYGFDGTYYRLVGGNALYNDGPFLSAVGSGGNPFQCAAGASGWSCVTARGYLAMQTFGGAGDLILGGGASYFYMHPNLSVGLQQNYPTLQVFGFTNLACSGATFTNLSVGLMTGPNGYVNVQQAWTMGSASPGQGANWYPTATIPSLSRFKPNVQPMSDADCLARIIDPRVHAQSWDTIQPAEYPPTDDPAVPVLSSHPKSIGFIVEEMIDVAPEFVGLMDNEPFGISYQQITALLWGAIRELSGKVDVLSAASVSPR